MRYMYESTLQFNNSSMNLHIVCVVLCLIFISVHGEMNHGTWHHEENHITRLPEHAQRQLLSTFVNPIRDIDHDMELRRRPKNHLSHIPKELDLQKRYPNCIDKVRQQGKCGSCWSFGISQSFGDRQCIHLQQTAQFIANPETNPMFHIPMSQEYILSCDKKDQCCNGGYLDKASEFMVNRGTVSLECMSYNATIHNKTCTTKCNDPKVPFRLFRAKAWEYIDSIFMFERERKILEALQHGPVTIGITVYKNFFGYKGGVYKHDPNDKSESMGGHAMSIISYGTENGIPYYGVRNSWGDKWGINGTVKIARVHNNIGLEDNAYVLYI
jgi:hypothetical protein